MNPLDALTQINLDDLVHAFGWQNSRLLTRMVYLLFTPPAREFARQMLEFDAAIGSRGLG